MRGGMVQNYSLIAQSHIWIHLDKPEGLNSDQWQKHFRCEDTSANITTSPTAAASKTHYMCPPLKPTSNRCSFVLSWSLKMRPTLWGPPFTADNQDPQRQGQSWSAHSEDGPHHCETLRGKKSPLTLSQQNCSTEAAPPPTAADSA